jgi:VIT1/CCC1 family predicted Fe2+/Mn2+ transporter
MMGVAASQAAPRAILIAAVAGLVAGAASMAVGEYVSVSSQRDLERALREREKSLFATHPNVALGELAIALQMRGIDPGLARTVATQIMAVDPVDANVRVKYGISEMTEARPLQAALASAASFATGSLVPMLGLCADSTTHRMALAAGLAFLALAGCGMLAAGLGGASRVRGALRVVVGGAIAMAVASGIGRLVGIVV